MKTHTEGCPLQHEKARGPGDCRICPQGEGCILLAILRKVGKIEDKIRELSEKGKT